VSFQESKLSYLILLHAIDAGIDDKFMPDISMVGLLNKKLLVNDAAKILSAVETYNQAHAAADAASEALEQSIQELDSASQTLRRLTVNDVLEIRGMTTPSLGVKLLMQCVCIVLRVKPLVKLDATRQPVFDYWEPSKLQLLIDPRVFLDRLWAAMGQDIDDSVVSRVEECLEHPDMSHERLKRITRSSVSDVAHWLRALCLHHRAKTAATRESHVYAASVSASKKLFMVPEDASPAQSSDEDAPFKTYLKGREVIFPALGCGVLLVLAYGPRNNFSIKDIQAASGIALIKVENLVASMLRGNALQQDKAINGVATFSIAVGVSFDAACAARHCKTFGLFKADLSYSLQVRSLASLSISMYEKKAATKTEPVSRTGRKS
jgi:hypothetical protein